MRNAYPILGFAVLATTLIVASVNAEIPLNARAVGMGGAYTALARDLEAPYWNPANLGLSDGRKWTLGFFNAGASIKNNSVTVSEYNRYTGKLLDDEDEDVLVNSIPEQGFTLDAGFEAAPFNLSVGKFALTQRVWGSGGINVDKDAMRLLILGNAVLREVEISESKGESYVFADAAISYGHPVMKWAGGEMTAGASFHYLRGLAYGRVLETAGGVITTDTSLEGSGFMRFHTSYGGSGFAFDVGIAGRFNENWFFSAGWDNLLSKVKWHQDNEERIIYFVMEPITAADLLIEGRSDSLVTEGDTAYHVSDFSNHLPPSLTMGIAKKSGQITWAVDWQQATYSGPGVNVNPRLAGGIEYNPWRFLPLRAGLGFGGGQGALYSLGFGLIGGVYHFDLGIANSGSPIPANSKGIRLATSMGLYF
jgi:hypothetical protein